MSESFIEHIRKARLYTRKVFFTGITALVKGQGLCYDRDYAVPVTGTAADAEGRRDTFVELPSATNNMWFAGVTLQAYPARVGGQVVTIAIPGSVVEVAVGLNTVVDSTVLTCAAGGPEPGIFTRQGFLGRGTAVALQTRASAGTGDVPIASSLDGSASVGAADKTLTKTALFTNAVVGDKVVILAGMRTSSGAAAVTPGVYTIVTRTSADVAVLDVSPCAQISSVAVYVYRATNAYPTCLCKLLEGKESGLQQTVAAIVSAEVSPAAMAGGTTYIVGTATLGGAGVYTLAAAAGAIEEKQIILVGTLTTNGVAITSAAMDDIGLAAAPRIHALAATFILLVTTDWCLLRWAGARWGVVCGQGTAPAA
jgi:hypothetical protein